MSVFGWLVVGLIEGFIASQFVDEDGPGVFIDLMLGVGGAVAGGLMFASFSTSVGDWNLFSIGAAALGAVVVLIVYHALIARDKL